MAYSPPAATVPASWAGATWYLPPRTVALGWWGDAAVLGPAGIPAGPTAGGGTFVTQQQFADPSGIPPEGTGPVLVTHWYEYRHPRETVSAVWFEAKAYAPPLGVFSASWVRELPPQAPRGLLASGVGPPEVGGHVLTWALTARPQSVGSALVFGGRTAIRRDGEYSPPQEEVSASWLGATEYAPADGGVYARWVKILPYGHLLALPIKAAAVGTPSLHKSADALYPVGLPSGLGFGQASVWNFLTYVRATGHGAQLFGSAYVQGGVKHVSLSGLSTFLSGAAGVVNTTADQSIHPPGMGPLSLGGPSVSPRILYAVGVAGGVGVPAVRRNPSPAGFESYMSGRPAVIFKTRYVLPGGGEGFFAGYPRVADRARKVLHQPSGVTSVFGDISLCLTSARVLVRGIDSFAGSPWADVRSTRRHLLALGVYTGFAGGGEVRNKTPSVAPPGFAPAALGSPGIGWRVRSVGVPGLPLPLSQTPRPLFWQTPGLRPAGIPAPSAEAPGISHGVRTVFAVGQDLGLFGTVAAGLRSRTVLLAGHSRDVSMHGAVRLEHGMRTLLAAGAALGWHGTPWVSSSPRAIEVPGVPKPIDRSTALVGGRRWLSPDGFSATSFGARIIPVRQGLSALGFTGGWGLAQIRSTRRYLLPAGVTTYQQAAQHWGQAVVWNARQYVFAEFDYGSGLNPPEWPRWTVITNRNRALGTVGAATARVGSPFVENGARVLLPPGALAPTVAGAGLVAYRVRHLPLDGLEPPYATRWSVVSNKAVVLRPLGAATALFGGAAAESNRRYLTRSGGAGMYAYGNAFVAPRVRGVALSERYAIAPPYIALPVVQLGTRYVDVAAGGVGPKEVGRASLQIIWRGMIPRWTHRDYVGEPALRNVTPELRGRGWVAEDFGAAGVRLEWRPVGVVQANASELFGRAWVADKRQRVSAPGGGYLSFGGTLSVARYGVQPPALQTVTVIHSGGGSQIDFIELTKQVPEPALNQQVIYASSLKALTAWGEPTVRANGIRVEPGYGEMLFGEPAVSLKVRRITAGAFSADAVYAPSAPRLSPHTIYSVVEAPTQAKTNHPPQRLHYVNESGGGRVGEVFGGVAVTLRRRTVNLGAVLPPILGGPTIFNRRKVVFVAGAQLLRLGLPTIPGPRTVMTEQVQDAALYGTAGVARGAYTGPQVVRPAGLGASAFTKVDVGHLHRKVSPPGLAALAMGSSRGGSPYAWQSLHVGPPMPTIPAGMAAEAFGLAWVSQRVRGIEAAGYDAFVCEYDFREFERRMRVRNSWDGAPPRRFLQPQGRDCAYVGAPSTSMGTQYIRPDGNSDQHRKGVTQ